MEKEYLVRLNERQREAAMHLDGAALVLAGPGSGKTSVITARAISLVDLHGIFPGRILTVTFSRAATEEMKKRYIAVATENGINQKVIPEYSTLHSFCLKSLKEYGSFSSVKKVISESNGKFELLKDIWNSINSPKENNLTYEFIEYMSNSISKMKCFAGSEKEKSVRKEIQIRNFDAVFAEYESAKRKLGYIDFDDMIIIAADRLREDSGFRNKIASKFDYIQIDEGQDMSFVQIEIIKEIGCNGNVFMVADDDQGIYGFRGADVSAMKIFEGSFAGCKRYYLEQNYRSDNNIIKVASGLIHKNLMRYDKNIFTLNGDGMRVELIRTADVYLQARFAAEIAAAISAAGMSCGILYRRNISAMQPLLALYTEWRRNGCIEAAGITGGFGNPEKLELIKCFSEKLKLEENKIIEKNYGVIKSPYAVYLEMERNGKIEAFREKCDMYGMSAKDAEYVICFLKNVSKYCKSGKEIEVFFDWLKSDTGRKSVFFSTVHSAKGLEYDCVVIIDATEDEFPKKTVFTANDIEEERRLFYVAMTRARKKLYIVSPERCGRIKCLPGLFFHETAEVLKA